MAASAHRGASLGAVIEFATRGLEPAAAQAALWRCDLSAALRQRMAPQWADDYGSANSSAAEATPDQAPGLHSTPAPTTSEISKAR